MIRLSQLIGQEAVALGTVALGTVALGTVARTGSVNGISIVANQIVAVQLTDSSIPASAVRNFEGDVLTYDETIASSVVPSSINPQGIRTLDMQGDEVGSIADLLITQTGEIDTIVLDNGSSVPGSRLRAVGTYAAVLSIDLPPPTGPRLG